MRHRASTRHEHAVEFAHDALLVARVVKQLMTEDEVEGGVRERERPGVADPDLRRAPAGLLRVQPLLDETGVDVQPTICSAPRCSRSSGKARPDPQPASRTRGKRPDADPSKETISSTAVPST